MREITHEDDPIVFHFRIGHGSHLKSKGGATAVFLPKEKRIGMAFCCSKDNYCKKWGRQTASARAKRGGSNRRFVSMFPYTGPLEFEAIKSLVASRVRDVARCIHNPVWISMTARGE